MVDQLYGFFADNDVVRSYRDRRIAQRIAETEKDGIVEIIAGKNGKCSNIMEVNGSRIVGDYQIINSKDGVSVTILKSVSECIVKIKQLLNYLR